MYEIFVYGYDLYDIVQKKGEEVLRNTLGDRLTIETKEKSDSSGDPMEYRAFIVPTEFLAKRAVEAVNSIDYLCAKYVGLDNSKKEKIKVDYKSTGDFSDWLATTR